jgi:hypothetical protein
MAFLKRLVGNTIPFSSLSGGAVYNSGFGVGGYGELSGFITSTGQSYYSSGTFTTPCQNNRTGTFTIDTRFVDYIEVSAIAGNDTNGGERPNNSGESFYLVSPSGTRYLLAPSRADRPSGISERQYDNIYGTWRTIGINLSSSDKSSSASFRFEQFSGCGSEWRDGVPQSVRNANQNARDRFGAQFVDLYGTPPNAQINSFTINRTSVCSGGSVTLSWTTTNTSSVALYRNNSLVGTYTTGSATVSVTSASSFYIIASPVSYYDASGNGAVSSTLSVSIIPNTTGSFTTNKTTMINNGTDSVTLSWSTSNASSVSITNIGSGLAASDSRTLRPTFTTTYTLTAPGTCNTYTQLITITVYQPPNVTFSLDNASIIRGQSTTLRWVTTGDATSATINNGIGAVNINGNRLISPTQTTTYTINVSGLGGTDSDTITLIVYQPPTVNISGPESLDYGLQGAIIYNATYADISLTITPIYAYKNSIVEGTRINLPLQGAVDTQHLTEGILNGQLNTQIPYNDFGPFFVTYVIVATGNGGQETKQITIPINVDETPENFLVPESVELLKQQSPIFTPDARLTSYEIKIDDIDIPVEVMADKPILVDKNKQQDWKQIRKI